MDYSPSGSSVHGISQARIWNVLPFPSPGDLLDPTQGSNLHLLSLLLWQVGSLPLSHLGNLMLLQIQTQVECRVTAHHTYYRIQVMSSHITSSSQVIETLPFRWLILAVEWAPDKVTVTSPSLLVLFSPISCLARKSKAFFDTQQADILRAPSSGWTHWDFTDWSKYPGQGF